MKLAELISNYTPNSIEIRCPYLLAEAGVNHEGSMDLARRLVEEAAEGGAHGIKFQTYKAHTLAAKESPSYWDRTKEPTASQFELFQKYDSFWKNEFEQLKRVCEEFGIEFFSTPFDVESATFLNDLMDVFKISSSDLSNHPFIKFQCQFGKPIMLSTGASYLWEIQQVVEMIEQEGNPLALLHCVLNYPTENKNANLGMIPALRQHFPKHLIGNSDHTLPGEDMQVSVTSALLGARVIEKHFTHDKTLPGNDHYHAMDKEDLKLFFRRMRAIEETLGSFEKAPLPSEDISRANARRSLIASRAISKGQTIAAEDLTWKRPASGISPTHYWNLLGKTAQVDIPEDSILQHHMFK
ncbi:MAG: N-acetylneuraminate synthase family protein [Bacteroidota bacterium]